MNRADLRPFWRLARQALRDAFAPRTCVLCAAPIATGPNRPLCRGCAAALPLWRRADGCPRCRMPSDPEVPGSPASWGGARAGCPTCLAGGSALHRWLAATRYSGPIQHLVPAFKNPRGPFGPAPDACRLVDYLAEGLAARLVRETGGAPELIVPIPLHPGRLRRRGFNQADWIAHRIARTLDRPFGPGLLRRIRDTGSQAGRTAEERRSKLKGAFRATARLPDHAPRVALVDDVMTTGGTFEAAAEALLEAGAGEVIALALSAPVAPRRREDRARDGASPADRRDAPPRTPRPRTP